MKPPNREFCLQRADDAARLAVRTHLVKVRDSLLDAERAWREMAETAVPAIHNHADGEMDAHRSTSDEPEISDESGDSAGR